MTPTITIEIPASSEALVRHLIALQHLNSAFVIESMQMVGRAVRSIGGLK